MGCKKLDGYMAGANLGGWISQYRNKSREHFLSFIVEDDIKLIASWGMDHIRIPVDYPVLEDDAAPGAYLEQGFEYLANGVAWAKKQGLNAVIDLHKAPGFSFGTLDTNTLFTDPVMQDRMIALWKEIARRFKGEGGNVIFELMNEVVEPDSSRWNPLAQRLIAAIREVDAEHYIMVGGNHYNSVNELENLWIFDDPKIVYNFHMYDPGLFTHQHAKWIPDIRDFNRDVTYPSDLVPFRDFAAQNKAQNTNPARKMKILDGYERLDAKYIRDFLQPAADFQEKHGKPMYCGEYGVIDYADIASRENYIEDVSDFLLERGIGRAVWSYKEMNFKLVDMERKIASGRLIKVSAKL